MDPSKSRCPERGWPAAVPGEYAAVIDRLEIQSGCESEANGLEPYIQILLR